MSVSPSTGATVASKPMSAIPMATRKLLISDPNQLPFDYSSTPGGTLFSTTPGGTRIIYERGFLMQMRNSPRSKSPPKNLPVIPGVTKTPTATTSPAVNSGNTGSPTEPGKENKSPSPLAMQTGPIPTIVEPKDEQMPAAVQKESDADNADDDDDQFNIEM